MTTVAGTFVLFHVFLSLLGVISGLLVVGGLIAGIYLRRWIHIFLVTTILTNVTGFAFPFTEILPSHIVGIISLVVLCIASTAFYLKGLLGVYGRIFIASSITALYLNVFVLIAQLLQKIPSLALLAPSPAAPAFATTQAITFLLFTLLGWIAFKSFPPKYLEDSS